MIGPFYVCLTSVISLISYALLYVALSESNETIRLIGWILYFLQVGTYTYTFLVNPGLPDKSMSISRLENKEIDSSVKICDKCGIVIPPGKGITHCDDCEVCIIGYDHHCPWTSKCIGKGNMLGFQAFVVFTMVLFGYLIFALSAIKN